MLPRESHAQSSAPLRKHGWKLLALIALPLLAYYVFVKVSSPELSSLTPAELGFQKAAPSRAANSDFQIASVNSTETIKQLNSLNGIPISELESRMRPAAPVPNMGSTSGFIGHDESLLAILSQDNQLVVDQWGLSHQQLAEPLLAMGYYAREHANSISHTVQWKGRLFSVYAIQFKGFQYSPFEDETKTNTDIVLKNQLTNEVLEYSLLVPHMIHRYGFYEGQGTPYRVDPADIRKVLELK